MTSSPPSTPRRRKSRPGLHAPFFTALLSLFATLIIAVAGAFMAGPDFADLYSELGKSDLSDTEKILGVTQNILSPAMQYLGLAAAVTACIFGIAILWWMGALIIRIARR